MSRAATLYASSSNPKKETKRDDNNRNLDNRLRRKSLDSATSSEPMKVLIRLSTLESKVDHASDNATSDTEKDSIECSDSSALSVMSEVSLEVTINKYNYECILFSLHFEKIVGVIFAQKTFVDFEN